VHFWDLADQYGTHPHARLALKSIKRDQVTILTKTHATSEAEDEAFQFALARDVLDYSRLAPKTSENSARWPSPPGATLSPPPIDLARSARVSACSSRAR